jgi:hypothetical protein
VRNNTRGITSGEKCRVKESRKESEIIKFMYKDTTNVQNEMYDYASNNCNHRISNKRFIETFVSHNRKTFIILITKNNYAWNITHNADSTAV